MAGRFGKYGDLKRSKALQRGRKEKARLAKTSGVDRQNRRHNIPSTRTSLQPADQKTHKSAVVVIPPDDLWEPIQALRKQYDRHFRRWMPHITLLYPFRPAAAFAQAAPVLARACRLKEPFEVRLKRFDFFVHSRQNATIYLLPEPVSAIKALQQALLDRIPDCNDVALFTGGFRPHLSLGQTHSRDIRELCRRWESAWRPLFFTLDRIHLIWRNDPPDDVFRIGSVLSLGST